MTDRKAHSAALRVTRGAVMVLALLVAGAPAGAQKAPDTTSQVTRLMQRGLYQDAVRLLTAEIAKLPEARAGRLMLMLGESHYMLGEHAQARPWFAKALPNVSAESDKTVAEYRLACVAYRMGDRAGAIKQIDTFLVRHAGDRRTGTLMVFKMNLLAEPGFFSLFTRL